MSSVIASIKPHAVIPQRLVGAVSADKNTGMVTIEYREPGFQKAKSKMFRSDELVAYKAGDAGFVVAMTTEPVVRLVGELTNTKSGGQALKTEDGVIYLGSLPGVSVELTPVEADSREARAAERGSKVKVRGARVKTAAKGERTARRAKTSAKAEKGTGKTKATAKAVPADKATARKRRREKA